MIYRSITRLISYLDRRLIYKFAYWHARVFSLICRWTAVPLQLPSYPLEVMGLHFPNPVGLAAGFDRDGSLFPGIACAGFGFVEIGTINSDSEKDPDEELTAIARSLQQAGIRSLPADQSVARPLIGISMGSMRDQPDERSVADFLKGMAALWRHADYLVVNLSRPGSLARTMVTDNRELPGLLKEIKQAHTVLTVNSGRKVPLIIKLAIDYRQENIALPDAITVAGELGFDGVLAAFEKWPCRASVNQCVRELSATISPLSLIAVGGIRSAEDARQTIEAGAALVQLFTTLTEQGPLQTRRMITRLTELSAERVDF